MHSNSLTLSKKTFFVLFTNDAWRVGHEKNTAEFVVKRTYKRQKERIETDNFLKKSASQSIPPPATLKSAPISDRVVFQRSTRIWRVRFHQNRFLHCRKRPPITGEGWSVADQTRHSQTLSTMPDTMAGVPVAQNAIYPPVGGKSGSNRGQNGV